MPRRSRSPRRRSHSPKRRSRSREARKSRDRHERRSRSREARRSRSREARRSRSRSKPRRRRSSSRSRSRSKPRRESNSGRVSTEVAKCIGVFGLSFRTNERDLEDEFSKFGELESVKLICHPLSKESRGFGFLTFRNLDDAVNAVEKTNGMMLHGRKVRVDFSMTNGPHQPTPGRYLGERRKSRSGSRSRSRSRSRSASRRRR